MVKWAGLIGSLFFGGAAIAAGDYTTGFGIITAALSSAGVIRPQTS